MNRRRLVALVVLCALWLAAAVAACGGGDNTTDGGADAQGDTTLPNDAGGDTTTVTDGGTDGASDGGSDGGGFGCDGGSCLCLGKKCTANSECCSGNCYNGSCQPPPCTADNLGCTSNAECCGGQCGVNDAGDAGGNTCIPLSPTCSTLGNPCQPDAGGSLQCCSHYCAPNGICSQPSYCGQTGDVCTTGADCCGGICVKANDAGLYGLCAQPPPGGAQCSMPDGVVCASTNPAPDGGVTYTDGGVPTCGGDCCSRSCAPYGPTGVLICQPASGCHPVGDLCYKDSDCCGGSGGGKQDAGVTICLGADDAGAPGVCSNPTGCKPAGDICRLQTNQCNATDNCCSGNVQQYDTCKQDSLGVPRCTVSDAGCIPPDAGTQCASSADCCNLDPCVPDGDGGFTCYPQACVPTQGVCTTDSDCCPGGHCYVPGGQTSGTCQPFTVDAGTDAGTSTDAGTGTDSGGPCALYGQICDMDGGGIPCCNNVPCTSGRCVTPVY